MARLIPYRIRLWWMKRRLPVCTCPNPGLRPDLHDEYCEIRVIG